MHAFTHPYYSCQLFNCQLSRVPYVRPYVTGYVWRSAEHVRRGAGRKGKPDASWPKLTRTAQNARLFATFFGRLGPDQASCQRSGIQCPSE